MGNVYFELTEDFNADGVIAVLASGQAVVFYRLAIMSKDGDWIVSETEAACRRVLDVLAARGARYRPSAPLHPKWLAGGWSSHFEFFDAQRRRIRCDFFSRPPRVPWPAVQALFREGSRDRLAVVDIPSLILMKRTQRAKDYAVIGELARRLPEPEELQVTTDVDRILELAPRAGRASRRPAVQAALAAGRDAAVVALARENDRLQQEDKQRLERYERAAEEYVRAFRRQRLDEMALPEAHAAACRLAEDCLPALPAEAEQR